MHKELDQMNVRVHHAVSDLNGTTGMGMVRAIVAGERDPQKLAGLRDPRCQKSQEQIAAFLTGHWRSDHLFNLECWLKMYDAVGQSIAEYEQEIQRRMRELTPVGRDQQKPPALPNRERMKALKRRGQEQKRETLFQMLGVDLTCIDGVGVEAAEVVISEYGVDLSKFETEKQFVAHVQLAPRQVISGGKPLAKRGRGVRKGNRVAQVLRSCATALHRSRTALGAYYRHISKSKGASVAIFATARKIAVYIFRLLKYGQAYVDEGQKAYEQRYQARRLQAMTATAAQMGYHLVPTPETVNA